MVAKEGADLGLEGLRERLDADAVLIKQAAELYGIPKIFLRNHLPSEKAEEFADNYEITPEYSYEWNKERREVKILEKAWVIDDDNNIPSVSLLAPPVAVSLIKQLARVLEL